MGGVLTVFPFPQSVGAPEVLQYKWEAYCDINWRCIAILFWEEVVVGVSDILLSFLSLKNLVAHDCGYPLSRYTCRATRVTADFLDFIAFCRCSSGVAPHPLKILVSRLSPPPIPGRCRTEIWVCKGVALHGGVAGTVAGVALHCATKLKNLHSSKIHSKTQIGVWELRGPDPNCEATLALSPWQQRQPRDVAQEQLQASR